MQILINLLGNAQEALAETSNSEKSITIKVYNDKDLFIIQITDNGMGIPPENLVRIFSYGYTTKKEGHGFGLHSSAISAMAMGGALQVSSEGLGKGATFSMELPYNISKRVSHKQLNEEIY